VPWTTLRATQFYDAILVAQGMAKVPVIPVPVGFRFQPVDTSEVAAQLVELTLGKPAGLVPDMAGPRVYGMADLRGYLRAHHKHRPFLSLWLPGKAAKLGSRTSCGPADLEGVQRRAGEPVERPQTRLRARPVSR
jgi:hypothetical protein